MSTTTQRGDTTLLMVGTRKGLFMATSDRRRDTWSWTGPHFPMEDVYSVLCDTRGEAPRLLAGCGSSWFGPQVRRSDDVGASWTDIRHNLPSEFGFPVVVDPAAPGTAYLFPIEDAGARWPVDGHARVWRTRDEGASWEPLGEGRLPDDYRVAVMRDAMCADEWGTRGAGTGLYFGGRNGAVWASPDAGETWAEVKRDLPDVMCVRAYAL